MPLVHHEALFSFEVKGAWMVDSGATAHIANDELDLKGTTPTDETMTFADGSSSKQCVAQPH